MKKHYSFFEFLIISVTIFLLNSTRISAQIITTVVGTGTFGYSGDGGPATAANIGAPNMGAFDAAGNYFMPDINHNAVRKIDATTGIITLIAGGGSSYWGDGGPATAAALTSAEALAFDPSGNLYIASSPGHVVRKITASSGVIDGSCIISTIAGTILSSGFSGDGGPATGCLLHHPTGVTVDASGNLYIADLYNQRVRKINTSGIISTVVGGGTGGLGDWGPATAALLNFAGNICMDGAGNLVIADISDVRIRKVTASSGVIDGTCIITTIVGTGTLGYTGDAGPATSAKLYQPYGVSYDQCGNLLIADAGNNRIRKVNTLGYIYTYAGSGGTGWGYGGYSGDGGPATAAELQRAIHAIKYGDNVWIADIDNYRIRQIAAPVNPLFALGTSTTLTVCENSGATNIDTMLGITNQELFQPVTWTLSAAPAHGTIAGTGYMATYLGDTLSPSGFTYTPTTGYSGSDLFSIDITDCGISSTLTFSVTVNPEPAAITGTTTICSLSIGTFSDATPGGLWSVDNATIGNLSSGPTIGDIKGILTGTTTITYTLSSTGCYTTTSIAVIALPVITGPSIMCAGDVVTFSDSPPGGTWSSGAPAVADVGSVSGIVTAIINGVTGIYYADPGTGCIATHYLAVYMTPTAILAATTDVCVGASIALSDAMPGGIWESGSPYIATVGSATGIVTGVSALPVVITYKIPTTGCFVTTTINVSTALPITGSASVCTGSSVTLSNALSGGTWSSSSPGNATIGGSSGIVTGLSPGSVTMTYTNSAGCVSTHAMSVLTGPAAITGPTGVCVGATITLSDATGGGTWSSSSGLATIGSLTGIVTGVSPGTVVITYKLGSVCLVTTTITINPLPATISATLPLCVGITSTLTNATSGGTWSSSNTGIATVGSSTGIMTGMATGVVTMTYMITSTGCRSTRTFTISPLPVAITGVTSVCVGATTTLSNASGSGTWSSGSTGIATVVSGSGVVTGVAGGTAVITFTRSTTGCYVTTTVTVHPLPSAITGYTTVCVGSTTVLSDADAGGTWTSGTPGVATVGAGTGIVTGVTIGTSIITYTLPTGCYTSTSVSVANPTAITGAGGVCPGSTITLSNAIVGGIWTSGTTGVATIGSGTGIVTGVATGTTTITYTYGTGCMSTRSLTVYALPTVYTVTGGGSYCTGTSGVHIYLANSDAGVDYQVFSSGSPVGSPVTGTGASLDMGLFTITGVYTIVATDATTGCTATMSGSATVIVLPAPAVFTVTGGGGYCAGGTGVAVGLSGSATGVNYQLLLSGSPMGSPVAGTGSAISFGIHTSAGTYTVLATHVTSGCTAAMAGSVTVTIYAAPPIAGPTSVCLGSTITLSDSEPGGTWISGTPSVATIGASTGIVIGVTVGTSVITYTTTDGCDLTTTITVHPVPSAIIGLPASVCVGSSLTLSDPTTGGIWTTSALSVATIGSVTGIVTGVSSGIVAITYMMPSTGCSSYGLLTVNPLPAIILGPPAVCVDATISLSDASVGGTWTSSVPTTGSVDASTGVVTGITTGTIVITYTLPTSCFVTKSIIVNPLPAVITGLNSLCIGGGTILLSDATSGGTWSSSSPTVASIGSVSRIVTPLTVGTTVITYKLTSTGCARTMPLSVYSSTVCPCTMGTSPFTTVTTPIINTPLGTGRYYVPNNTLIDGGGSTITFSNTQLIMAGGVQLDVDWSTELILTGAHLYGCPSMWQGLVLQPEPATPSTISARILVTGGTLIEDAFTAIYAQDPVNTGAGNIVETNDAIFNRNITGIEINNYIELEATYPFAFKNTVFTSRNFNTYTSGASTYPNVWPSTTASPKGLKYTWSPATAYDPPFNIDNPSMGYSGTACKNGVPAQMGIKLSGVGTYSTTVTTGVPVPSFYAEVQIGDDGSSESNANLNMFDALAYGVYAQNTNFTCVNNVFMHISSEVSYAAPVGGIGVYAKVTDDYNNHNRMRVYKAAGSSYINSFYDFYYGIAGYNYFNVMCDSNDMVCKNRGSSMSPKGAFGLVIKSMHYDAINLNQNNIANVNTGIAVWSTYDPMISTTWWTTPYKGEVNILANTLKATLGTYGPSMTQRMHMGISVQNAISAFTRPGPISPPSLDFIHVDYNNIYHAENGIFVNGYWDQRVLCNINGIQLRPQSSASVVRRLQYGINHTGNRTSTMYANTVHASDIGAQMSDSARAYYAASNLGIDVGCNAENHIGRGYEFFLNNTGTRWHDNTIQDNFKGMVLNGSIIGAQHDRGRQINNEWVTGGWTLAGSSPHAQTYVYNGALAIRSPITVHVGGVHEPIFNDANPPTSLYQNAITPYSINTVSATYTSTVCPTGPVTYHGNPESMLMFEDVAQNQVPYTYGAVPHRWISQFELWRAIYMDSSLTDSSAVVAKFDSMTVVSRYAYLADIERDLALGDFASVTVKLGYDIDSMANTSFDSVSGVEITDGTGANYIVQNYQQFYGLYIKYVDSALTGSDSLAIMALANLCPELNGGVVYQARALYSDIYRDLTVFNDDSCMDVDTGYIAGKRGQPNPDPGVININAQQQNYTMYPNPNNGTFEMRQAIADKEPVVAEVFDVVGRKVGKEKITFNASTAKLRVYNVSPGIYLLQLTDSKKRIFKYKFVIE